MSNTIYERGLIYLNSLMTDDFKEFLKKKEINKEKHIMTLNEMEDFLRNKKHEEIFNCRGNAAKAYERFCKYLSSHKENKDLKIKDAKSNFDVIKRSLSILKQMYGVVKIKYEFKSSSTASWVSPLYSVDGAINFKNYIVYQRTANIKFLITNGISFTDEDFAANHLVICFNTDYKPALCIPLINEKGEVKFIIKIDETYGSCADPLALTSFHLYIKGKEIGPDRYLYEEIRYNSNLDICDRLMLSKEDSIALCHGIEIVENYFDNKAGILNTLVSDLNDILTIIYEGKEKL